MLAFFITQLDKVLQIGWTPFLYLCVAMKCYSSKRFSLQCLWNLELVEVRLSISSQTAYVRQTIWTSASALFIWFMVMLRKHLWYIVLCTSMTSFISISLAFLPHPFPWMPWDFSILQGCPHPALSSLDGIPWFATSPLSGDFPGGSDGKSVCL